MDQEGEEKKDKDDETGLVGSCGSLKEEERMKAGSLCPI